MEGGGRRGEVQKCKREEDQMLKRKILGKDRGTKEKRKRSRKEVKRRENIEIGITRWRDGVDTCQATVKTGEGEWESWEDEKGVWGMLVRRREGEKRGGVAPSGLLWLHYVHVDLSGVLEGLQDSVLGDLVEHSALERDLKGRGSQR
jgi:hypothetical protein